MDFIPPCPPREEVAIPTIVTPQFRPSLRFSVRSYGRNWTENSNFGVKMPFKFKDNRDDGYTPLLKYLFELDQHEDLFKIYNRYTVFSILEYLGAERCHEAIPMRTRSNNHYHTFTIMAGMLSGMGLQCIPQYSTEKFDYRFNHGNFQKRMTDIPNFFYLGLVKTDKLKDIKIEIDRYERRIVVNSADVKIVMSEDTFKKPAYMNQYYSKTVRSHMIKMVRGVPSVYGIPLEVMEEKDIISKYTYPAFDYPKINSLPEMMSVDYQVKNKVFNNLTAI